ncbi:MULTISPECIES: type II toxin-antitoxin system death-on-curing family toxin [Arsenicicoccus]|uniref:type II toxin-antitoxin system death-on-curing family toxin n=1 Tax=Arsenicicoccus TaxID=267408 RepID=UPI00257BD821|nr:MULTISPECIES: Fic family protein [Arsenicicoccus]
MTYMLTVDQVLLIHGELRCTETLTNRGALEAALAAPLVEFEGHIPYPTVVAKAAKLLEAICRAHPFGDGNKRVSWLACLQFLQAHGMDIADTPAEEVEVFILTVIEDRGVDVPQIVEWILDHLA